MFPRPVLDESLVNDLLVCQSLESRTEENEEIDGWVLLLTAYPATRDLTSVTNLELPLLGNLAD